MTTDSSNGAGTPEALRQFAEGFDFESPALMIGDLTPEQAAIVPAGCPYSIAGVVAHTLYWQQLWLDGINEKPTDHVPGKSDDWPQVPAAEWDSVRSKLLTGIDEARRKSEDRADLSRKLAYGLTVEQTLLRIALHNSYHLGQVALLRQLIGLWPPTGRDEG